MWYYFFFFKQKTAYEMRISDWSSDVCSSDLSAELAIPRAHLGPELGDQRGFVGTRELRDGPDAEGLQSAGDLRPHAPQIDRGAEIGRASCRERVCQYV